MSLSSATILVTGANGFIGSHLVERLVSDGHRVRALAEYNPYDSWGWLHALPDELLADLEVVVGDIRDPDGMRSTVDGCDTVFHLAALVSIPHSYVSPASYVETNVMGTVNVLRACVDFGVSRVVHTSTSEVYGTAQEVPITESHPLRAQSPYAASKIGADQMAMAYHDSFDLPVTIVRPFNTYGPRQSARAIIPTVITQLASGDTKVKVGNTAPTRDFSYVADTVAGFIALARADNAVGRIANLGTGHEISIGDLIELIGEVVGVAPQLVQDRARVRPANSEVMRLVAANDLACELSGWQPEFNGEGGLREGLRKTALWFSEPDNLARYQPSRYST